MHLRIAATINSWTYDCVIVISSHTHIYIHGIIHELYYTVHTVPYDISYDVSYLLFQSDAVLNFQLGSLRHWNFSAQAMADVFRAKFPGLQAPWRKHCVRRVCECVAAGFLRFLDASCGLCTLWICHGKVLQLELSPEALIRWHTMVQQFFSNFEQNFSRPDGPRLRHSADTNDVPFIDLARALIEAGVRVEASSCGFFLLDFVCFEELV